MSEERTEVELFVKVSFPAGCCTIRPLLRTNAVVANPITSHNAINVALLM